MKTKLLLVAIALQGAIQYSVYSTQLTEQLADASQRLVNKVIEPSKVAPRRSEPLLSIRYQPLQNVPLEKGGFIEESWLEIRLNGKKIASIKSNNQPYTMPIGQLKQDATLTIIPILWRQLSQNSKSPGQNIIGEGITIPIKNIIEAYGTTIAVKHNPKKHKQIMIEKAAA